MNLCSYLRTANDTSLMCMSNYRLLTDKLPDKHQPYQVPNLIMAKLSLLMTYRCFIILWWSKFDPHRMMPRVLATRSLHHSGAIPETALFPEDAYVLAAPILSVIPELHPFRRLQLRSRQLRQQIPDLYLQSHHGNRSSLISAFSYAA